MAGFDSDEEGDEADRSRSTCERVPAKEFAKRTFVDLKRQIQNTDAVISEPEQFRRLGAAVNRCQEVLREGRLDGLEAAIEECRSLVGGAPAAAPAAGGARPGGLDAWRPGLPSFSADRASPDGAVSHEPGAPTSETPGEDADVGSSREGRSPRERKAEADEAVGRGEYADALAIYEDLLALPADEACRAAIFSNAALCALKLCATLHGWGQVREMLLRVVSLCDGALRLDGSLSKAHFRRGCALEALERRPEAYRAYERAALLAPADPKVCEALDRMSRYEEAELGPEVVAAARARLKAMGELPGSGRRRPARAAAKFCLGACCRCGGDGGVGNFYAAPCGHGPVCRDCRAAVAREGRGLEFCPSKLCGDLVGEWRVGPGESAKQPKRTPGRRDAADADATSAGGGDVRAAACRAAAAGAAPRQSTPVAPAEPAEDEGRGGGRQGDAADAHAFLHALD